MAKLLRFILKDKTSESKKIIYGKKRQIDFVEDFFVKKNRKNVNEVNFCEIFKKINGLNTGERVISTRLADVTHSRTAVLQSRAICSGQVFQRKLFEK